MESEAPLLVETGRHVELELRYENGESEQLSLDLVPDRSADFARGFLGEGTPLAQAIRGLPAGSVAAYHAGDVTSVRILAVTAGLSAEPEDLTERRQETLRQAVRASDKVNAIIFASSMNSKWGDYDPSGIQDDWE